MRLPPKILAVLVAFSAPAAQAAPSLLDYVGECVPFARAASGIQLYGDAWTWWDGARDRYRRGIVPREGAVLVFRRSSRLRLGHVAVVSRVLTPRIVMVTHANWSRRDGARGHAERDVTLTDVSARGDWSEVRVFFDGSDGLGGTTYPVYGFVYPQPIDDEIERPRASPELTSADPDYIGTMIQAGY